MTPKLSRRQFVLLGAFVFVGLVLSGGLSFAWSRTDSGLARLVKAVVRKKLGYLQHDEEELTRFARDYVDFVPDRDKRQQAVLVMLLPIYALSDILRATPARGRLALLEETVVMKYLMSTDYFYRASAQQDAPLHYRGLYWPPYSMPCGNPFADLS